MPPSSKQPGDFRSRKVAGRPVIFCRDQAGEFHCLFNTCRHRGAIVCTQREGNARRFMCIYHGWTYGNDGQLLRVPGDDAYAAGFDKAAHGLRRPARFEDYRGFWFMCLDAEREPAARLSGGRQGLYRPGHRPVAVRADGDHRRRAGIRRRRQLEADGGEQRRRLSPAVDPFDLAQLHGQFGRQDRAAAQGGRPGAAHQGPRGRARQRPFHHRQRQFPRPAGRQMDSALRRARQGARSTRSAASWSAGWARSARAASPTPTAIW